jgi:hypothetical protein
MLLLLNNRSVYHEMSVRVLKRPVRMGTTPYGAEECEGPWQSMEMAGREDCALG